MPQPLRHSAETKVLGMISHFLGPCSVILRKAGRARLNIRHRAARSWWELSACTAESCERVMFLTGIRNPLYLGRLCRASVKLLLRLSGCNGCSETLSVSFLLLLTLFRENGENVSAFRCLVCVAVNRERNQKWPQSPKHRGFIECVKLKILLWTKRKHSSYVALRICC